MTLKPWSSIALLRRQAQEELSQQVSEVQASITKEVAASTKEIKGQVAASTKEIKVGMDTMQASLTASIINIGDRVFEETRRTAAETQSQLHQARVALEHKMNHVRDEIKTMNKNVLTSISRTEL